MAVVYLAINRRRWYVCPLNQSGKEDCELFILQMQSIEMFLQQQRKNEPKLKQKSARWSLIDDATSHRYLEQLQPVGGIEVEKSKDKSSDELLHLEPSYEVYWGL